jgi:hypothetical protein
VLGQKWGVRRLRFVLRFVVVVVLVVVMVVGCGLQECIS